MLMSCGCLGDHPALVALAFVVVAVLPAETADDAKLRPSFPFHVLDRMMLAGILVSSIPCVLADVLSVSL